MLSSCSTKEQHELEIQQFMQKSFEFELFGDLAAHLNI